MFLDKYVKVTALKENLLVNTWHELADREKANFISGLKAEMESLVVDAQN